MVACMLCGGAPEPGFNGLCRPCCVSIKKTCDDFAAKSKIDLERARIVSITAQIPPSAPAPVAPKPPEEEELPCWPKGMPL